MRRVLFGLAIALAYASAFAQTVPSPNAPFVWRCPVAIAEGAKDFAACTGTPTLVTIDVTQKVFAGPSTAPVWRTFSALAAADLVRVCPRGNVTADKKGCTTGKSWVAKSTLLVQQSQVESVGHVKLSWVPPTKNTDDTALTNLKGYNLYQATTAGALAKGAIPPSTGMVAEIEDAGILSWESDLGPGTFYWAVTATAGTLGAESTLSEVVSKTIMAAAAPTVALSCAPKDGVESVVPTCTWSSSNAIACSAAGGWSGAKALADTQALPAIKASVVLSLACTGPGGTATTTVAIGVSPRPAAPSAVTAQ